MLLFLSFSLSLSLSLRVRVRVELLPGLPFRAVSFSSLSSSLSLSLSPFAFFSSSLLLSPILLSYFLLFISLPNDDHIMLLLKKLEIIREKTEFCADVEFTSLSLSFSLYFIHIVFDVSHWFKFSVTVVLYNLLYDCDV